MEPIFGQAYGAKQMKLVGLTLQRTVLLLFSVSVPISFLWLNMKSIHYADKMNQSPQWLMCSSCIQSLICSFYYYLPCLTVATSDDDDHRHLDLHRWPSTSEVESFLIKLYLFNLAILLVGMEMGWKSVASSAQAEEIAQSTNGINFANKTYFLQDDSRCQKDGTRQGLESAPTYYPPCRTRHNLEAQTVPEVNKKGTNWAVLVGVAQIWDDYRHESDMHHVARILKRGGIDNSKIITFSNNIIAHHKSNPYKGSIFNHENGSDVYPGVPLDYVGKDATAENLLNVLLGNRNAVTGGSGKVVDSGPKDRIFLFITTHGRSQHLKMPHGPSLKASDLIDALKIMYKRKSYDKMVISVEACEAGSMFEGLLPKDMNIYATTAANATEASYGCYWNFELNTDLGNTYNVSWMEHCERSDLTKTTLDDLYKEAKERTFREKGTHVMLYGTKEMGSCLLSDFFGSRKSCTFSSK